MSDHEDAAPESPAHAEERDGGEEHGADDAHEEEHTEDAPSKDDEADEDFEGSGKEEDDEPAEEEEEEEEDEDDDKPKKLKKKSKKDKEKKKKDKKERRKSKGGDDDGEKKKRKKKKSKKASESDSEGDSEAPKKKKHKKASAESDASGDEAPKRKRVKKPKKAESEAGSPREAKSESGPPKEQTLFDQVLGQLKKQKSGSRRKKDDQPSDEEVEKIKQFIQKMKEVAVEDKQRNVENLPAIGKLQMLPEVTDMLTRKRLHQTLMDEGVLEAVRDWLEPLPDDSLPNVTLRTELYRLLGILPVDQDFLNESGGLGKRLAQYVGHAQETEKNKETIRRMLEFWCRSVLKLEVNYKKLAEHESEKAEEIQKRAESLKQSQFSFYPKPNAQNKRAQIPEQAVFDFARRPEYKSDLKNEAAKRQVDPDSMQYKLLKKLTGKGRLK